MKWFSSIWQRIQDTLFYWQPSKKPKLFLYVHVDEPPEILEPYKLYLVGEEKHLWAASMICPCGCKEIIQLNLLKKARPCWSVQKHTDGSISLNPSIWRQKGCRSHFFLRRGQIDWY